MVKKYFKLGLNHKESTNVFHLLWSSLTRRPILLMGGLTILIALPILFLTLKYQSPAHASWLDDNWQYRQTVNITNAGSAQTNFQVPIVLNTSTLITAGKMQSTCADIRITDVNGKLIPYWIAKAPTANSCNQTTTNIWTKLPSIPTTGTTVYVYYGNASATSVENGFQTFVFFDDGNTISNWNVSGTASQDSTTGNPASSYKAISDATSPAGNYFYKNINLTTNTIIEFDNNLSTNNGTAFFYLVDSSGSGQVLNISDAGISGTCSNTSTAWNAWNGMCTGIDITANVWHNGKIVIGSTLATAYFDSIQAGSSYTFSNNGGYIGYNGGGSSGSKNSWLDNIRVRKYAATEPTVAAPTNEEAGPGPVAHWKLDEGNGITTYDSTQNANNGTMGTGSSAPTWITEDLCISGKCLRFDGTNDYVSMSDSNSLDISTSVTISATIKLATLKNNSTIVGKRSTGSVSANYALRTGTGANNDELEFYYSNGGTWNVYTTNNANLTTGTWYNMAAVYNGSVVKIYKDGLLLTGSCTSGTCNTSMVANTEAFGVGRAGNFNSEFFSGIIDNIKIYAYARTASQILTEYNSHGSVKGASTAIGNNDVLQDALSNGLKGYWKVDESTGNPLDSSGSGISLTNNATVTFGSGYFGNAASFTAASSQYLSSPSTVSGIQTVSMWVNPTSTTTYLVTLNAGTSVVATSGTISTSGFTSPRIFVNGIESSTISASSWSHVVVTSTAAISGSAITYGKTGTNYFNGKMDELRLYNRTLSPAEVSQLANWAPGPVGYWNMDENAGTSILDRSGNGNAGTLTNSPTWTTGKYGQAVNFSGNSDYITIPTNAYNSPTTTYSTEGWFKTSSTFNSSSDYNQGIVDKGDYQFFLDKSDGKAKWVVNDNTAKAFSALGTGSTTSIVRALAVWNGNLYAGGDFSTIGTCSSNCVGIAKWDGSTWSALSTGADTPSVRALAVWNGNLYAGGDFNAIGTCSSNCVGIAKWDGSTWSALSTGTPTSEAVYSLAVWNGYLIAGGTFSTIGTCSSDCKIIAKWDGSTWTGLETGGNFASTGVYALTVWNGNLYAGGAYTVIGSCSSNCNRIAKWDGSTWSALSTGTPNIVNSLVTWNGNLYAGGDFTSAGTCNTNCNYVAKWDGSTWTGLVTGSNDRIRTLIVWNGYLYAGGVFTDLGDTNGDRIAKWDGSTWSALSTGSNNQVYALTVWNGNLYLGGDFTSIGTCSSNCNRIAKWGTSNTVSFSSTTSSWTANQWYHFAITSDGSTEKIYINSILESSTASALTLSTSGLALYLGKTYGSQMAGGSGEQFNGGIDDIRLYNYARTQKQITQDMNGGHPSGGSPVGSQVGYWKFNEGYGSTAYDSSPQVNNVALAVGDSTPIWTNNGQFGKALTFDGTNDYVRKSGFSTDLRSRFTISTWINSPAICTGTQYLVELEFGKPLMSIGSCKLQITLRNPGDTAWNTYASNTTLVNNTWYHLAVTYDTTTGSINFYVNGRPDGNSTHTSIGGSAGTTLDIGGRSTVFFNGTIDEVKIYNSALTSDEIKIDYNQGSSLVLGSYSIGSGSTAPQTSDAQEYCVPGDTSACLGPVGRWDMEEGIGSTAYDTSVTLNNGALGIGNSAPAWVSGKVGKALSFDGSRTYVRVPAANGSTLDIDAVPVTVEAWVLLKSLTGRQRIVLRGLEGVSGFGISYNVNSNSKFNIGGAGGSNFDSATTATTNRWYHIAGVTNGASSKLYINGILETTGTVSIVANGGNDLDIGAGLNSTGTLLSNFFNGYIDHVRVFNYERTAAQIAWDYNRGGPIGWWKFDEASGSTAYDSSGVGNTGAITIGGSGTQTAVGTITTASTAWGNGATGKYNYSLNFDGTDDYVNVGLAASLNSVSFWVKPTSTTASMINLRAGTSITATSGTISASGFTSPTYYVNGIQTASPTLTASVWNHIVVTTATTVSANAITIAKAGGLYTAGQMDDVRIFPYALTSKQVINTYNQGAGSRFGPSSGAP